MCGDRLYATAINRIKGISQPVLGVAKVSILELRLHALEFGADKALEASEPKRWHRAQTFYRKMRRLLVGGWFLRRQVLIVQLRKLKRLLCLQKAYSPDRLR